jgi:multimeric flavodoxin WrbA
MRRLLIVWWSATGASRALAEAAQRGALEALADTEIADPAHRPTVSVICLRADQAGADRVLDADALLFVAPENLGSLAGVMKDFFDRCWYLVLDRIQGRAYASIICAGSDGSGALRQIERFATGWRLKRVIEPLTVITHAQTPERILAPKTLGPDQLAAAGRIGAALSAGLAAGIW